MEDERNYKNHITITTADFCSFKDRTKHLDLITHLYLEYFFSIDTLFHAC